MSWIGNLYDHFHEDLNMPELPGMSRDRAQEIVAEAFAPGSPAYHHLRQNSQVAEFLLPGLDLNFEENYSDFYNDLVDTPRTDETDGPPPQGNDCPPPQIDDCSPPQGNDCPPPKSDDCSPQSNECPSLARPNYDFLPYEPDEIDEGAHDDRPERGNDGADTTPDYSGRPSLEGGRDRVEIRDGEVPPELSQYAKYENGMLIIDGRGEELPPLHITSDNVIMRNARIKGDGSAETIRIDDANNVQIENCEITGGTRGVQAWDSSNISVKNSWLHDFSYNEGYDTTAVEFNRVNGGNVEGNRVTGLYHSDAVNMFESQNIKLHGNTIDITIDEWSSAPLMVEGNSTSNIEVYDNVINYEEGNNVPPGLLGGTNLQAYNNEVNGNRSVSAWQMYAYNPVWNQVFFDGQLISPS